MGKIETMTACLAGRDNNTRHVELRTPRCADEAQRKGKLSP